MTSLFRRWASFFSAIVALWRGSHPQNRKQEGAGELWHMGIPPHLPEGAILSHNHPSGHGPSDSDIKAVLSRPGTTLRIVTANEQGRVEVFQLRAKEALPEDNAAALVDLYREEALSRGDTAAARRAALELIEGILGGIVEVAAKVW